MNISTTIYTFVFGKFVGKDNYGNSYYRNQGLISKDEKRWVIYKGIVEATKIPPLWYRWVHHITDELPSEKQFEELGWQKKHLPNLTATSKAYHPSGKDIYRYKNGKESYQAWQPED